MTMYGKIIPIKNIRRTLLYNEQKLKTGIAECILSGNFIKDLSDLSLPDKFDHFNQLNSLNTRSDYKALHIFIGFPDKEKISNAQMRALATRYMEGIDFGNQPYLVYRHYDALNQHLHVVTPNIRFDGSRINLNKADLYKAHQLTRQLEIEYSLVKYEKLSLQDEESLKIQHTNRLIYGRDPIKRSIGNVLNAVIDQYKYTDLAEFNAILRLYNVRAVRPDEKSPFYQNKGILYYPLDEHGNNTGMPIKASDFLIKPTLATLEKRFTLNESLQQEQRQRIKTAIDWTLAGSAPDWEGFREALEQERISVVLQPKKKGGAEDIFFVDHESKTVFGGESLGSQYRLDSIRNRCVEEEQQVLEDELRLRHRLRMDF
jgi:hypothetical protein